MRVLLTGAAGFAGHYLTVDLARRGFDVVALTRRSPIPAVDPALAGNIEVIKDDLCAPRHLPDRIDAVVHTASTSPRDGISADDIVRDNVVAMRAMVRHAVDVGARCFVFFSTMSVFGRIMEEEVNEATPVRDPDVYGLTKRIGEEMLAGLADRMASITFRLPGIVGPGAHRNWLAATCNRILEGKPVSLFNPDAPFNNAVHVVDLATLVENLLRRDLAGFDVLTLAAAGRLSVREVIERMMVAAGRTVPLTEFRSDRRSFVISIEKATRQYGYSPMDIGETVQRFVREQANVAE